MLLADYKPIAKFNVLIGGFTKAITYRGEHSKHISAKWLLADSGEFMIITEAPAAVTVYLLAYAD